MRTQAFSLQHSEGRQIFEFEASMVYIQVPGQQRQQSETLSQKGRRGGGENDIQPDTEFNFTVEIRVT